VAITEQPSVPTGDDLLTVREVADLLRCTPRTVQYAINDGRLPAYHLLGRHSVRVARADLEAFGLRRVPVPR
jgi:excisionase family DNA binding protein